MDTDIQQSCRGLVDWELKFKAVRCKQKVGCLQMGLEAEVDGALSARELTVSADFHRLKVVTPLNQKRPSHTA